MKQNKGLLVVLLIMFIVIFGAISLFQVWNNFVEGSNKKEIGDESFTSIDVLSDNAAVEIISTNSSETTVEYIGEKRRNTKFDFQANVKNDELTVKLKEKRWGFLSFDLSFSKIELLIKVPEKQYDMIKINNNNGKIKAENMKAKDIKFETDNGRIELKNVDTVTTQVDSNNGKILLEQVSGEIIGKTNNGGIMLVTDNLDRPIYLTTDNGRIEIQSTKEPTNVVFDVKTDNGKIDIFGKSNEQTMYGTGKHLIKLRTDNGRITVTK